MKNSEEEELLTIERRQICKLHADRLDRIDHALYGNGSPSSGLIWIATENGKVIRMIKRISWATLSILGIALASKLVPHLFDMLAHGVKT